MRPCTIIVRPRVSHSHVAGPIAKMIKPLLNRRTAPWFVGLSAIVVSRDCRPQRRSHGSTRPCGCSRTAARLYATVRLFVNFFQPSFKLAEKKRDGARVHKRYHRPATPCQRLLADPRTPQEVRDRVTALHARLDPVRLLSDIRTAQQQLVDIADRRFVSTSVSTDALPIEEFLAGLRIAWKDGEVRPTARSKPKQKRGRRRPDPLAKVTVQLRTWFTAEPWRTGRELLERLQAEYPGSYPTGLLRTLQRRLKIWRSEIAHTMVFGAMHYQQAESPRPAGS